MYKNQYGATWIAARYCGLSTPPDEIDALWMHGWVWDGIIIPEQLFGTYIEKKTTKLFVANAWQEDFLKSHGYKNSYAIGLPNVYLKNKIVKRTEQSLLVMPGHTIKGMVHDRAAEKNYVDYIKSIESDFAKTEVVLNAYDYEVGIWKNSFEKAGFKVISGPFAGNDLLQEQQDRMQTFSHMTTNQVGSHIVYAGALGMKVSIAGPYMEHSKISLEGTEFYKKNPEVLENILNRCRVDYWKVKTPWLFSEPSKSIECLDWAYKEIGYPHKKTPNKLKRLLEWTWLQQYYKKKFNK